MGALSLADFEDDLNIALGDREEAQAHLKRWVNFAYLDLCTGVDFEILDDEHDFNSAVATRSYTGPTTPLAIKIVFNVAQNMGLDFTPKEEYFRLDGSLTGTPELWTLHMGDIYVHPTPIAAEAFKAIYKKTPDLLSAPGDTTILQAGWDPAVSMLASYYGFMALGEEQRGVVWYNRAISYVNSRMSEDKIYMGQPGLMPAFERGNVSGLPNAG